MNCEQCYHYQACLSVDVTGFVADPNKNCEEPCEHFLNPEDVQPISYWVRRVSKYRYTTGVRVRYVCNRCGSEHDRVYTQEIMEDETWNNYMKDHWMPKNDLYVFCHGCGAKMDLDKTDHTNHVVND